MPSDVVDPLDSGIPWRKRWEEFQRQFSSAQLLGWLFEELREIHPEYPQDLGGRLQAAICDYPDLLRQEGEYDGWVPVHGHGDGHRITWMAEEDAQALFTALFPHGIGESDPARTGRAFVVIGMHSALEVYAEAVGVVARKGLPQGVRVFLEGRGIGELLDSRTYDLLAEFDAVRHLIVHRDGVVDERYVRAVAEAKHLVGERRVVSTDDVHRFGAAARRVALLLRRVDESAAQ